MMGVLVFAFSYIMRFNVNDYAVFLLSGIVPWTFIAVSVESASTSIISAEGFIKKVYIPKMIFPLARIGANFVNMVLSLVALFVIISITQMNFRFGLEILFLPFSFLILFIAVTGIGLIVATVSVYFRDVTHIVGVGMSLLFYATPIIYPLSAIPERIHKYLFFNPFLSLIELFRAPLYDGKVPQLSYIVFALFFAISIFLIGIWFFSKYEEEFIFRL
jgi:ABC-type polysaccharide/polyol phosphate export permease